MSVRCPRCGAGVTLIDESAWNVPVSCYECGAEFVPSEALAEARAAEERAAVDPAGRGRASRMQAEFRVGDVIGRSFSLWSRNLVPFSLLAWLVFSPVLILDALLALGIIGAPLPEDGEILLDPTRVAVNFFRFLLQQLLSAALIAGVFQRLRGRSMSLGASLDVGIARFLPAALVSFVYTLIVILAFVPMGIVVLVGLATEMGGLAIVFLPVVSILGAFVSISLLLGVPVTVVEKLPPFASLGRSWQLTSGRRLPLFFSFLLVNLILWLISLPVGFVLGVALAFVLPSLEMITVVVSVVLTPLQAIGSILLAVAYHDLRVAKEGIGTEELAAVFD